MLEARKLGSEAAGEMAAGKRGSLAAKSLGFTLAEVLIPKRMRGIINGVSNSRVSKIKEPSRKTKKLCAFTLAEVLITLAIIGVVAALTIPVIVAKYQQQQYYTQFLKVYNTLSGVIELSKVENGSIKNLSGDVCDGGDCATFADTYIAPFLKVAKACDDTNYEECITEEIKGLGDGEDASDEAEELKHDFTHNISRAYLLQDGSSIVLGEASPGGDSAYMVFYIDTNGIKEPNKMGRDIFVLDVQGDKPLMGHDDYIAETTSEDTSNGGTEYEYANCNPSESNTSGVGCAARLLLEGKMNY